MAFVRSLGSVTSADTPPLGSNQLMNYQLPGQIDTATFGFIYKHQPNVQTVVSFLARNIAQLKLKTYQKVKITDRKELLDHPMAVLLGSPNPYMTPLKMMQTLVSDLAIYGVAYFIKARDDEGKLSLVRVPPLKMEPVGDNWVYPDKFRFLGTKDQPEYPADQIVYLCTYNPDANFGGTSPIDALRTYLVDEYQASQYRGQVWKNGARMQGYIHRPVDAPSKWDKDRFRRQWRAQYTGSGPEAGGTPVLEDGMTFVPASFTPAQAEYVESRKLTREEVANAYHIPPPMVGILEHATFSNVQEQHKMLYMDCLGPWLTEIEQEFMRQLMPEFTSVTDRKSVYVEFNIQEKLEGDFTQQADGLSKSVGGPWMTRNEGRARLNLPAIDGGDELVTPLNVTAGGQSSPQDGQTPKPPGPNNDPNAAQQEPTDPNKPKADLDAFIARQKQALASKLGASGVDIDEVFNAERWTKELKQDLGENE